MPYHTVFRGIHPKAVAAVKHLVRERRFFRLPDEEKRAMIRELLERLSSIYGIPSPVVVFDPRLAGNGLYHPAAHLIGLPPYASLVTALHEFRHAMQARLGVRMHRNHPEHDARAWSLSLYHAAAPRHFRRAVERGPIFHLRMENGNIVNREDCAC